VTRRAAAGSASGPGRGTGRRPASRAAARPRVVCLGSLNIDVVYRVASIVRRGETIAARAVEEHAGGKGANQAAALALAGARVFHVGQIGRDGLWLKDELERRGVDTRYVRIGAVPTGKAIIQLDDEGENAIIVSRGANAAIDERAVEAALRDFGAGDAFVAQNETAAVAEALRAAHARGLRVVLNPSPIDDAVLRHPLELVDVLVVNQIEASVLVGEGTPEELLARLGGMLPSAEVVLTLGAEGAVARLGESVVRVPAVPASVVDTTAAGDTFLGFFVARRLAGDDVEQSLRAASAAASLAVSRRGAMASIPTWTEVKKLLAG
jgi:ribokinase